jgi:hypothetical protein
MKSITIPATPGQVDSELLDLGGLITAKKWHRAALVAARVRLGEGQGTSSRSGRGYESASTFAERRIVGLASTTSVSKYVQAWLDTHDGEYPAYGQRVTIPDTEFPPMRTGTDGYESDEGAVKTVRRIVEKHGSDVIAKAVDLTTLSRATAAKAQDERVERNRARVSEGGGTTPPSGVIGVVRDPGLAASLMVRGLSDALRGLVTTFPQEWNDLSDEARQDADFRDVCLEALDRIEMNCSLLRAIITAGDVFDRDRPVESERP